MLSELSKRVTTFTKLVNEKIVKKKGAFMLKYEP
jgi:hypothetical protein